MIATILTGMMLICIGVAFTMVIRSTALVKYRSNLLIRVSKLAGKDTVKGINGLWRYDVLTDVNYDEMLFKFWRKFDSFYPDKSFIGIANESIEETLKDIEKDMKNKH